jgi:hypothetical protein
MHAARMHIRAPSPFRGWAGAVQPEGQTCFSSGCAVDPHGPCTLGKGREMFQPLYEVAPCVCVPCSRCGDVHKRSRTITGHIYGYLWRSRCIFSLRSGRGRVWPMGVRRGNRVSPQPTGGEQVLDAERVLCLKSPFRTVPFSVCSVCAGRRDGNTRDRCPMAPSARKGSIVVDCGGHGQWGPNTLGYLLGL